MIFNHGIRLGKSCHVLVLGAAVKAGALFKGFGAQPVTFSRSAGWQMRLRRASATTDLPSATGRHPPSSGTLAVFRSTPTLFTQSSPRVPLRADRLVHIVLVLADADGSGQSSPARPAGLVSGAQCCTAQADVHTGHFLAGKFAG
jgi:hypothetical protein